MVVVVGGNGIKAKLSQTELVWALTELGNNTTDVNDHFTSSSTINNIFSFKSTSIKDKNFWNNMIIAV